MLRIIEILEICILKIPIITKAAKNYDRTLELLDPKTREFLKIQKNRKNLDEVIKDEAIAKRNDSIINVYDLKEPEQIVYYENYIQKLKSRDELKKILEEKQKKIENNILLNGAVIQPRCCNSQSKRAIIKSSDRYSKCTSNYNANTFYFYNPNTVAYGKLEFKKLGKQGSKRILEIYIRSKFRQQMLQLMPKQLQMQHK